ncbi:hypothetical protein CNBF0060 [Cryptococcus deneoformans B-3501A]|uniref:hypothetical protein n=1 Tax=Cryptococcus deneoformans (strain B-3501A) TaxID=283643 RepID=UPI000042D5BF|nr:hypothetical protein CNBF0060 [Cryptococcus neoformans var. neoformans B-3501A]EAL20194.1 hypothetical protein CNBF0060 [Cryptococcus neoformans var. neoformans B-3501A]
MAVIARLAFLTNGEPKTMKIMTAGKPSKKGQFIFFTLQAAQRAASDEDKLQFGGLVDRGGERRIPDAFNTLEDFQKRVVNTFREFWQQELSEGWHQPTTQQSGSS